MASAYRWAVVAGFAVAACGDNTHGIVVGPGPALVAADSLFIAAHLDDDLLFMQPQITKAVSGGSSTTVYVLSGDPVYGIARAERVFEATMTAYAHAAGSSAWDCGYIVIAHLPAHHCRLRDRPVSMIGLDVQDGGRDGKTAASLIELVDGSAGSLPLLGPLGGRVTEDGLVAELAEIIAVTAPHDLHTLDRAATHGDDHPGHLFTAAFAMWAAARAAYHGTIVAHRGYDVTSEPANLSDADYALARPILGYFEACYSRCAACGTSCATIDPTHEIWLRRQYASTAAPIAATSALATDAGCLAATGATGDPLGLADCAAAGVLRLDGTGHLRSGALCAASGPANSDPIALVSCAEDPAQYWLFDDEGFVWNGRPPVATTGMDFDHVRCLSPGGAPICGAHLMPHWQLRP